MSPTSNSSPKPMINDRSTRDRRIKIIMSATLGTSLVIFLMAIVFLLPNPSDFQRSVIRLFMALGVMFLSYFAVGWVVLKGTLRGQVISASGGFVLFILTQFIFDPFTLRTKLADVAPAIVPADATVESAQRALKVLGYYNGNVNGIDDSATRDAIRRFQKDRGLKADGYIGPETKQILSTTGPTGYWLSDKYIAIRIATQVTGTLLSEEEYRLKLDLESRTSMPLYITEIIVERYNHEAAAQLGLRKDLVFTSHDHVMRHFEPNKPETVDVMGNQTLPRKAIIKIRHSLSDEPSQFHVDLGGIQMPMPGSRRLSKEALNSGVDALPAIDAARKKAIEWSDDVTIVAAYPGNNEIRIDSESRLKFAVVKDWIVSFYSFKHDRFYALVMKDGHLEGVEADSELVRQMGELKPAPFPLIGNQKALELLNHNDLLCGNWNGPRLFNIEVEGKRTCAWILPYRGPDSLPLFVDALNGDLLRMVGNSLSFKRIKSLQPF